MSDKDKTTGLRPSAATLAAGKRGRGGKTRRKRGASGAQAGSTKPATVAGQPVTPGEVAGQPVTPGEVAGGSQPERVSAKEAAVKALTGAGDEGLEMKDIVERVLKTKGVELKGKTPQATIAAIVSSSAKKGVLFKKVGRARYALLEASK